MVHYYDVLTYGEFDNLSNKLSFLTPSYSTKVTKFR
jgi:hypothetical protein